MPFIKIHVKGRIGPDMLDWFHGYAIESAPSGDSYLTGEATDNSAIYGLISTLSTLGIMLISVSVTDANNKNMVSQLDGE